MTVQREPGLGISTRSPRPAAPRAGAIGLAAAGASFALTAAVAVLGPSIMEPALPGGPGQPPWAVAAGPSPYLAVALTAAAILTGVTGLSLSLYALRHGWSIRPGLILIAGIAGALVLAFLPPFGSADHLSYAAYGRMAITGHDPYTTTPAALARLGDPVARAVQDWRNSPSVYGPLAVGLQAFAGWIGAGSVRLTIFVLSLLNAAAFAGTGLLLHWLGRGDVARQRRSALLWTANPLLLMLLIGGAHVDTQAIVFAVAAVAAASLLTPRMTGAANAQGAANGTGGPASAAGAASAPGTASAAGAASRADRLWCQALIAAGAGALIGLGFAIKVTTALVGAGLAIGILLTWRRQDGRAAPAHGGGTAAGHGGRTGGVPTPGGRRSWRWPATVLGGLAAGFAVVVAASLVPWGTEMFGPALRAGSYTSIGSPWRPVRSALELRIGDGTAEGLVKLGALLLAAALLAMLLRHVALAGDQLTGRGLSGRGLSAGPLGAGPHGAGQLSDGQLLGACAFAVVFAWLLAWPYLLPWYDGLGWALLVLLPASRLDWLLLARTAGLAIGYLPARGQITVPAGLTWLESVVRTAVTPAVLLAVIVATFAWFWPWRRPRAVTP